MNEREAELIFETEIKILCNEYINNIKRIKKFDDMREERGLSRIYTPETENKIERLKAQEIEKGNYSNLIIQLWDKLDEVINTINKGYRR